MPATAAVHSYNSTISIATTVNGTYTAVAEVIDINDDLSVTSTKATHLLSPSAAQEYIPGLVDGGQITLTVNHTTAGRTLLMGYLRQQIFFKITDSDTHVTSFAGFLTKVGKKVPLDDRITMDVSVKVSGLPTYA